MYEHRYQEIKSHGQPSFPIYIYKIEHSADTQSILPVHWHNEMEIIFQVKGKALFRIEGLETVLREGDALIVHAGELHSGINNAREDICYYSIVFKLSWLSSFRTDRVDELFLSPLLLGQARLPTLLSSLDQRHTQKISYITQIITLYEQQTVAYEMSIKGLLLLLIANIHQSGLSINNIQNHSRYNLETSEQIKQVLDYMEEHAKEKLTLDQLAEVASLSRSHFCTFFKKVTGMRPMEYLNYIRINKAAKLLRTGKYNVLEAALESGYQHLSYFSKWFKYYMNMTPLDYKSCYSSGH